VGLIIRSYRDEDRSAVIALWRRVFPDAPAHNLQVRGTNRPAVSFYRCLGYEVEDRISMGKKLERGDDG